MVVAPGTGNVRCGAMDELASLTGLTRHRWAIWRMIDSSVSAFIWAKFLAPDRPAGRSEYSRILRFAEAGERFSREIDGLVRNGEAYKRVLLGRVCEMAQDKSAREGFYYSAMRNSGPLSMMYQLQALVDLIATNAREVETLGQGDSLEEQQAAYYGSMFGEGKASDKRKMDRHCLFEAMNRMCSFWGVLSKHPFSTGKYHTETSSYSGAAVRAAHLILRPLDPTITERKIATAIGDVRAVRNKN